MKIMQKSLFKSVLFLMFGTFLFTLNSCNKEKGNDPDDGLTKEIRNILSDDALQKLRDLGIAINSGKTPPLIEGKYIVTPFVLVKSNFEDALKPGYKYPDLSISFYSQNNSSQTIKSDYSTGPERGTGVTSYITGSGNKFSVFTEVDATYNGTPFKTVNLYSGELVTGGIKDFQFVNLITQEAPGTLKKGEGRLVIDQDKMSERK